MSKKNNLITVCGVVIILCVIIYALLHHQLTVIDTEITTFIQNFTTPNVTSIAKIITHLGSATTEIILFICISAYCIFHHLYKEISIIFLSLVGTFLLNEGLKYIFKRTRPTIEHLVDVTGYSFPSGHAMVSITFYGMISYIIYVYLKEQGKPFWYVPVISIPLILLIGISRIYLGVHFPSDVLAGFLFGELWLLVCINIFQRLHVKNRMSFTIQA